MHASESSRMRRVGNAVLRIFDLKISRRKLFNAERPSEKASIVAHWLQLNKPSIAERCWMKLHGDT